MGESLSSLTGSARSDDRSDRLPVFAFWTSLALMVIVASRALNLAQHTLIPEIPVIGRKWFFEPLFITRFRYIFDGWGITREGYRKVMLTTRSPSIERHPFLTLQRRQYPNKPFTIVRPDSNVTVLPTRYVDELQNVHDDKLHPIEALSAVRTIFPINQKL